MMCTDIKFKGEPLEYDYNNWPKDTNGKHCDDRNVCVAAKLCSYADSSCKGPCLQCALRPPAPNY